MKITAVTRLKHGPLYEAAKRFGSASKLAVALGIGQHTVSDWMNLKTCPPQEPNYWWPQDRLDQLEQAVMRVLNVTLDDLFPPELRDAAEFRKSDKRIEKTMDVEARALADYGTHTAGRLTASPNEEVVDFPGEVEKLLSHLPRRERTVLRMRYGLDDGESKTLEEVGAAIGCGKERTRQIEAKAKRKLQHHLKIATPGTWRHQLMESIKSQVFGDPDDE